MKKVLALVLALVFVLGFFPFDIQAATGFPAGIGMSDGAHVLDGEMIEDFGNFVLGIDKNTPFIPILWEGFTGTTGHQDITEDVMNEIVFQFSDPDTARLFQVNKHHYGKDGNAKYTLTPINIGRAKGTVYVYVRSDPSIRSMEMPIKGNILDPTINKNIVYIHNNDPNNPKPTDRPDDTKPAKSLASERILYNDKAITEADLGRIDARPMDELRFYLNTDFFQWEADISGMSSSVRKASLVNDHITVYKKIVKGSAAIKEVTIDNFDGMAYVVVRFAETFDKTKELDFELEVALAQHGKKADATAVTISGTMSNEVEYVSGVDYAFLGDNMVIEADEFCKNVELDLGDYVSVYMSLQKGKRYYGKVTDERTDGDIEIMEYYPTIKKVLNLKLVNISGTGNIVQLKDVDKDYYVYDADGDLLGQAGEMLPLRTKYFLSEIILNPDPEVFEAEDAETEDVELPEDLDNPSTGAGGVSLAVFGMVVLAAGCFVSFKKKNNGREEL